MTILPHSSIPASRFAQIALLGVADIRGWDVISVRFVFLAKTTCSFVFFAGGGLLLLLAGAKVLRRFFRCICERSFSLILWAQCQESSPSFTGLLHRVGRFPWPCASLHAHSSNATAMYIPSYIAIRDMRFSCVIIYCGCFIINLESYLK